MADIRLDANVARTIARVVQMDDADSPMLRAFHGVLADILLTASDADEAPMDGQIRKAICARIEADGGIPHALINFAVKDGQVEIRGAVANRNDRETVLAAVRRVHGVKGIHDHVVWMDRATHAFMPAPDDSRPG